MSKPIHQVALAIYKGTVHLCIEPADVPVPTVKSLCRDVELGKPRMRMETADLANIAGFNICWGCELRFQQMGYKNFYLQHACQQKPDPCQMTLF